MPSAIRVPLLTALVLAALPAAAQDMKDFKNWFAACDNLRDCSAYGFDVEMAGDARAYLRVERKGAATAPVTIAIAVHYNEAVGYTLAFDDASLPGLPTTTLTDAESEDGSYRRVVLTEHAPADVLIDSIRKAQKIVITLKPAEGKKIERPVSGISLSGAVAALLWIDDQQKRIDTVTAMIRRGGKPASSIPAQPKAPGHRRCETHKGKGPDETSARPDQEGPRAVRRRRSGVQAGGGLSARRRAGAVRLHLSRQQPAPITSTLSFWSARPATRKERARCRFAGR